MGVEDLTEARHEPVLDLGDIDRTTEQPRERCDAAIRDPARHDEIEVREIGRHVERETVARNPSRDPHTDRGQLVASDPHAGESRYTDGINAVAHGGADE